MRVWTRSRSCNARIHAPCVAGQLAIPATHSVHDEPSIVSKMVDIGLILGSANSATFLVYSDEAAGRTADAAGALLLHAEHNGTGDGRVYLIAITSADDDGNLTHTCLTAVVPKSQSASDIASVNEQASAALTQCPSAPAGYFVIER